MSADPPGSATPPARLKLHGRRRGKALRPGQRRLVEERLPALRVPAPPAGVSGPQAPLDPAALLPGCRDVWLEIGFGGGEHLVHVAQGHPDVGLIGAEPFLNGVAKALARLEAAGVGNVRLHPDDARDLIDRLAPSSIGRVFLLYPDPWPKSRHAGRRYMNPANLEGLARVMRAGAELRLATDIPAYAAHARAAAAASRAFAEPAGRAEAENAPWPGWPGTRYEAKALRAGRRPHYLTFVRT